MSSPGIDREEAIAEIARLLPQRTGQLGRLVWRHARTPLPRGMAGVLSTLSEGPETISRLAEREGVAQPTLTRMVERLEADDLVRRRRLSSDGRVVTVEITPSGEAQLAAIRATYLAVLSERLGGLTDRQLIELRDAGEALQVIIDALRD